MKPLNVALRVLCAFLMLAGPTWGAVIANYQGDYLNGAVGQTRVQVSADGWNYMWNSGGAIGTAGNYTSLLATGGSYTLDGSGALPRAEPAAYVSLHGTGGHPGRGVNQGGGVDRFPIAAYTIQPGEAGLVRIINSSLYVPNANSTGVEARIYVNNNLVGGSIQPGGASAGSFNAVLGFLNVGDTVYVGLGPNLTDGSDSFNLAFQLETFSDASARIWDADGAAPVNGGTGVWDTVNARWADTGGVYGAWNNAANLSAIFPVTSGAVTLGEAITARSLSFSADGYTVGGASTLTLTTGGTGGAGPAAIEVAAGTAAISAPIAGSALNKIGMGTLRLEGSTVVPALRAAGGNLVLAGSSVTNVAGTAQVGVTAFWGVEGGTGGILTVQDSASLTAGTINMGENWTPVVAGMTAVINQTSGTVTVTGNSGENASIRVGHWPNETSTYNLSGGTLTLTDSNGGLAIGTDGTGIFNQTGGTLNTPVVIVNHRNPGGNGTFTVRGGVANIGAGGIITAGAPYAVNLGGAGGTLKATADWSSSLNMTINGTGNSGAFFDTNGFNVGLSGSLTGTGWLHKIGDGTLTLTGGTHTLALLMVSDGALTLTGAPTVNISGGLHVAVNQYTPVGVAVDAALNIGSGSLTAQYIVMGDASGGNPLLGSINQTGGTVTTTGATAENNGLRIGHYPQSNVAYNLSGGTLTIGGGYDLSAATDGTGWFNQTGGILNVERIVVNKRAGTGGSGRVTLAGGTANIGAGGIITDSDPSKATLEYGGLGGAVRATATFSSPLNATLSGIGASAITFDTNGNAITLSGVLSGAGGLNKAGTGDLTLSNFNTYTGGTTVNGGRLLLGAGGAVGTVRGTLTVNSDGGVDYIVANAFGYQAGQSVNVLNINGGTVGGADAGNHFWNNFQLNMTGGTLKLGGTLNEFHSPTITVNASPDTAQIVPVTGAAVLRLRDSTSALVNVADGAQAVDLLISVPITQNGASALTKIGAGTMAITGAGNSFSELNVAGGTVVLGGSSVTTGLGTIRVGVGTNWVPVGGSGTLVIQDTASVTTSIIMMGENWPTIPGMTAVINQTGGTVTITGNSTENAAIRIGHWGSETSTYNLSGGTLNITDPTADIAIATDGTGIFHQTGGVANTPGVQVNHRNAGGNATLIIEGTGVMNIGARGLNVAAGTATLGGSSVTTVTGNVSVGDWTFAGTSTLTIRDTATLNANGAEFMVGDSDGVPGAVSQTGGTVNIAGRTRIAHWPNNTSTYTLSGGSLVAAGSFNVGWDGTGIFTQTGGSSQFNAGLTITAHGGNNSVFNMQGGTSSATRIGVGAWGGRTGTLNITGGDMTAGGLFLGDADGSTGIVNHSGGTLTINGETRVNHWPNNTSTYTLSGAGNLVANGVFNVGWDGTGVFIQNGGTSHFNAGLVINAHNGPGATFTLNGGTADASYVGIGRWAGRSGTLNVAGGALTTAGTFFLGDANSSSGAVNQTGGTVNVAGQIRVAHWPNETSTYNISAGTLNSSGGLYVGWDGTGNMNVSGTADVNATASTFVQRSSTLTIGGNATFDTNFMSIGDQRGAGTVVQNGGTVTVSGGNVRIAHWPAGTGSQYNITAGTLNANSGLYVGWDGTGAMNVSGSADVNAPAGTFVQRSSTLTIGGNATFDGNYLYSGYDRGAGTTIFAGNSVSTFGGNLLLRSGGTVEIKDSANVTASQVFQGTAGAGQWGTINQSGGTLTLTSTDGTRILTIGEYPGATSYYNLSGGTVTALNGSGRAYIGWDGGGQLNITGGLAMFKNLRADGQGGLLTLNGGELRLGSGGIDNPSGPVTINLGGGTLSSYESWSSAVAMNLTGIGGNVTIAPPSGNTITLNGVLGGSGGFNKTAAGTLTLTNNNTYSGNTDVQAGTLALVNAASNNNIPNSAVVRVAGGAFLNVTGLAGAADLVLASGQTLKGNGTVVGNLTAGTGSHVAPGDSPGILTVNGNVTMNAGSFFDVEIEGPTPGIGPGHYDQLVVNGLVNLNDATLNLIFGYPVAVGQTFTIINNDGFADLVNGTFANLLEGSYVASGPGSLASALQITYRGNDGNDVVLTGVPEPSTVVLAALGLAGLAAWALRRRLWRR